MPTESSNLKCKEKKNDQKEQTLEQLTKGVT